MKDVFFCSSFFSLLSHTPLTTLVKEVCKGYSMMEQRIKAKVIIP
jgi:hypothetical protein